MTDVTLLSVEEAKALRRKILDCDEWWCLRSPGYTDSSAAYVFNYGSVNEYGNYVSYDSGAVRPAFIIPNLKSSNLKRGDTIEVAGIEAFVVSDSMALARMPVGCTYFRKDRDADDAIDYEKSDIKIWLEKRWRSETISEL